MPDLRTATRGDREALSALFARSAFHWESDRPFLLANPHHLAWDGAGLDAGRTRLASVDGRICGFASWEPGDDGALEVVDLFVDPPMMGRGIGRALVADLVERAAELGSSALLVTGNPNALGFYLAVGFQVIGDSATAGGPGIRLRRRPPTGPPYDAARSPA